MDENQNILEIEDALLGVILYNTDRITDILDKLHPNDFSKKINSKVYEAMISLYDEYTKFDESILEIELIKRNIFEQFGGREKIVDLLSNASLEVNLEAYVDIIKNNSIKSKIKTSCNEIIIETNRNYKEGKDLLDYAQAKIFSIENEDADKDIISLSDLGREINKKLLYYTETGDYSNIGIKTGYTAFDKLTGGLHGSDLLILAARPAVGKTAFALNLALNVAKQNKTVLLLSLEMGVEQLYNRMLAITSGINAKNIKEYKITESDTITLSKVREKMDKYPLFISGNSSINVIEIKNIARKLKKTNNLEFIVIDYLQLITSLSNNKQREQQVSEISRALKILAKELNIPILALSQLSRGLETRKDKKPMLSDLRESGAIEQDADLVMFLHREEYYKNSESSKQHVELIIGKHRNGSTGSINLGFNLSNQQFDNEVYILNNKETGGNN